MGRSTARACMSDLARYVGTPYSRRMDCYGLVRQVLADLAGVQLPAYRYPADPDGRAGFVRGVMAGWVQVAVPRVLDVVLLRVDGVRPHVGVVAGRGVMLHSDKERGKAVMDRFDTGAWQVDGFFRWPA